MDARFGLKSFYILAVHQQPVHVIMRSTAVILFSLYSCTSDSNQKIKAASDILSSDSTNVHQLYMRSEGYYEQEEYQLALKDISKAISLGTSEPYLDCHYRILRADIYFNLGRLDKAMENYDQAIEIRPQDEYAYLRRGYFKCKVGESTACQDLYKAMELGHFEDKAVRECCKN